MLLSIDERKNVRMETFIEKENCHPECLTQPTTVNAYSVQQTKVGKLHELKRTEVLPQQYYT